MIIPTLFPYFLPFCYPYILSHPTLQQRLKCAFCSK